MNLMRALMMVVSGVLMLAGSGWSHAAAPRPDAPPARQETRVLHSEILGEDRTVEIFLPDNYKPDSADRYDVLYVLDGEMLARYFPPVRSFAEENDLAPPFIIVSIRNNYWYDIGQDSRDRDLLPKAVAGSPLSGGADKFQDFLAAELIPYIDKAFPTTGRTMLFGHSYAGMFAIYSLLTRPELFDAYIASDPALWWNNGYVIGLAPERLARISGKRRTLFIGGRSGRIGEAFGLNAFTKLLESRAPRSLRWQRAIQDDEDHGSVRLRNIYDGLKFTYFGHSRSMIDFFPQDGILVRGKPGRIYAYSSYLTQNPGIRYTTDGTEPDERSPRLDYGIPVSAPAEMVAKQFSNWGTDRVSRGHFRLGRTFAAQPLPETATPGGLRYSCYRSSARDFELSGAVPLATGRTNGEMDLRPFAPGSPLACSMEGYIRAETGGYHVFLLSAGNAATLSIDGVALIDVRGANGGGASSSFVAPLARGYHRIRMTFFHSSGDRYLDLTYLPAERRDTGLARLPIKIPAALQFAPRD